MPLSFYETKEKKRPPLSFYPEGQKRGLLTFYPEEAGKPSLEQLAEEWQTREEFQRKAQEAGYVEKEPSEPLISLRHIPEHFRRKPKEEELAPITDIPIEELTQLIPKPKPAEALSTLVEGLRGFRVRPPTISPREPEVREPMMFKAPPEEEAKWWQKELRTAGEFAKFPYTIYKETTLPMLAGLIVFPFDPEKGEAMMRTGGEAGVEMGKQLGSGILDWLKVALLPSTSPHHIEAMLRIAERIKEAGWLAESVHPLIFLTGGRGMLKRTAKVVKGAKLGWKGMPTEDVVKPILPLSEEARLRPLAQLGAVEKGLAEQKPYGIQATRLIEEIREAMKPEGEYVRWWKEQLEPPPERLRRSPAEAELLRRKLRALEEKPSVFEKRKPEELVPGEAPPRMVPGEAELKLKRELEPKLEEGVTEKAVGREPSTMTTAEITSEMDALAPEHILDYSKPIPKEAMPRWEQLRKELIKRPPEISGAKISQVVEGKPTPTKPVTEKPVEIPKEGYIPKLRMKVIEDATGDQWQITKIEKEGWGLTYGYKVKNLKTGKSQTISGVDIRKGFTPISKAVKAEIPAELEGAVAIPKGWKVEVQPNWRRRPGWKSEVDWQGKRIVFESATDAKNLAMINHEIAHIRIERLLTEADRKSLLDEYAKIEKLSKWEIENKFHHEKIGMDYGTYLTEPSKVSAKLSALFDRYFPKQAAQRGRGVEAKPKYEASIGKSRSYVLDTEQQTIVKGSTFKGAGHAKSAGALAEKLNRQELKAPPITKEFEPIVKKTVAGKEGKEASLILTAEEGKPQRVSSKFKVVEVKDMEPSHNIDFSRNPKYPEGLQERPYHTDKAEQLKVLNNAKEFIPEFLVNTNPDAINGAPVVSGDGIVFGGNSRVMSAKILYKEGRGAILKDYIIKNAEQFGLNPTEVRGMKEPILVREIPSPKTQVEATTLIRRFNESFTQQLTANAEALAKAKLLSPETIESLVAHLGPEESLAEFLSNVKSRSFLKALSKEGIIDRRNVARYVNTETGLLNEAGKELIGRLLTAKVITQPDVLEALPKTFLNKVSTIVPSILKTRINPELDLAPMVQKIAKAEIGKHASPLKTIDEYLAQRDIFAPPEVTTDVFAIELWKFIDESGVKKLREAFRRYAKIVEQQGTPTQAGFGFVKPLSKAEIFETAFRPAREPISEVRRLKKRRELELHAGIPIRPIKTVNQIIRFMDDVAAKYITKPLHQRIMNWIEDNAPVSWQEWWNKWAKTLYKADPELALFMRRFRGGAEFRKLAVRKAGVPLMVKEGEPLTTIYGRPFKAEVIKRRLGQLMAPTTIRPGRQPRAKPFPARPARKLSELLEMTPDVLIEAKRRVGKTMTRPEAEGILEYAKKQERELAKRGIKKEEIPLPEAGITPIPRLAEATMGARIVEAELGKALYDLGLLSKQAFKEFYGIHLKRMYESVELAREQRPRVPGLRIGLAKKLRMKMLTQRGKTAIEAERARWTKQTEKTQKQLSLIKIENIKGLGKHFTWRLKDAGYGTLDKLMSATPEALMANVKGVGKGRAASFKSQAERFLAETKPKLLKDLRQQRRMKKYAWMRVDLPSEWQREAGRYMTPEKPFLKGSYATLYNIQTGKLLKDIGAPKFKGKFWDEIETAKFSERIPDTKEAGRYVYGDLAGRYVSKKVLAEIKPFLELPSEANRALNAWLGLWKMGKVAGAIGTQIRNIYFNVGPLSDFARVGVKDYIEACKEYKKRGEHYQTLLKEGYLETDYFKAEVEVAFRSLSRFKEENLAVHGAQLTKDLMGKLGFNKAVRVYQTVDQVHKMAVYVKNIRAGLPKAEALKETYKWSQNYREVPQMAEYLRTHATGFVAPFLTFSFEAARFLKNAAIERPITLAKWVAVPFLLRAWAQKRSGLSDKEMNQLIKSLPKDRSLYSSLLVPTKVKGEFYLVDLSYTFPWMDIYGKIEKPWDIALGSPVFKTTMEAYTGIDSWTGKPIIKPEDTNTIDVIKRWGDHLYKQAMPSTAPEIPGVTEGGYEWRRIAQILKGKETYYGEKYPKLPALVHTFGGVPIREFQLRRELGWKEREIDTKIQELKRRRSALKYNRGLTIKQKLRLWHKLTDRMKELSQERVDLMTGK